MECPREDCRFYPNCDPTNRHHLYWPSGEYKSGVEKRFRQLGENIVEMCRDEHVDLHATTQPPDKPSRNEMLEVLNGG